MWRCSNCHEKIEDGFDICWQCGTTKAGKTDGSFMPEIDAAFIIEATPPRKPDQATKPPASGVEAFTKGGCACCLGWTLLCIMTAMVGGVFFVDFGGGLLLFLIGGIIGLMVNSAYRQGVSDGRNVE